MGGHYGTVHVRTTDRDAVRSAVESIASERTGRFLIAPAIDGWVTVYPDQNGQDKAVSEALAAKLPGKTLIHCLVHDDDIFAYWLFEGGRVVDTYNSCPDYFGDPNPPPRGGNARALAHLLLDPAEVNELQALLDADRFTFELERQDQFAALLGLPNTAYAYEYLQGGETDGVRQWKKFVHVPDLAPEKAARRAAAAQVRAELKQLQRDGILLLDELAEKSTDKRFFKTPAWAIDPSGPAIVRSWQDSVRTAEQTAIWQRITAPAWQPESWDFPGVGQASSLQFSPTGSRLAVYSANRSRVDVWDTQKRQQLAGKELPGPVIAMSFSPDECWLFVVVHNHPPPTQLHRIGLRPDSQDALLAHESLHFEAIIPHPDGRLLALVDNYGILVVVDATSMQVINQAWIKETNSLLPEAIRDDMVGNAMEKVLGELKNHMSETQLDQYRLQCARHFLPKEAIRLGIFSPDGDWLFCGTRGGLRALKWDDVLHCPNMAPVPVRLSADAQPAHHKGRGGTALEHTLVYGVVYDVLRERVLFSGLEGKICFLELNDGGTGDLLSVPARASLIQLALTPDRLALVATAHQFDSESNRAVPTHFQVWSYPALCRINGLDY
jgi:hypothetical protein